MTATDLLAQLEQAGCQLTLDGGALRARGQLTDDLRQAIKANKPALVALLRERQDVQAREAARLLKERGWVAIRSRVLNGEVVLWTRDGTVAVPARWKDAVTYTLNELRALVDNPPGPEGLKAMHEAKKVFGGRIEAMPDG